VYLQGGGVSLSVRTRFEVFKRDRFTCAYCGKRPPEVTLEVDHMVPRAAGGSDEMENLITSCWECNHGKADRLLEESSAPTVTRQVADEAKERVAQAQAYAEAMQAERELLDRIENMVMEAWAVAFGADSDGSVWTFTGYDRFPQSSSVRRILRRLPVDEALEAVDITASKFSRANSDAHRYFFGICWRKVTAHEAER
jgi:hypothetical protein